MLMDPKKPAHSRAALYALGAPTVVLAVVSFLPLIETNTWWIRYLDFPRLQFLLALTVMLALLVWWRFWRSRGGLLLAALAVSAAGYHLYRLHPYTPAFATMAAETPRCADGHALRVMSFNVKRGNREDAEVLEQIAEAAPDLLLLMETDAWWDERLAPVAAELPHHVQAIPDDTGFYGLHLFSRHPLIEPDIEFWFAAHTPTVLAGLRLPDGEEIGFIGLHPRPPLFWSQPTTMRDAHMLSAALHAADSERPFVVAGDLNAVPWERVTRRAMRIGRFLDPRVGRGIFPTYDAQGWVKSWPLDQILFQNSFGLVSLRTLEPSGSDHRPVVAEICLDTALTDRQAAPEAAEDDLAEARASVEAARAMRPD